MRLLPCLPLLCGLVSLSTCSHSKRSPEVGTSQAPGRPSLRADPMVASRYLASWAAPEGGPAVQAYIAYLADRPIDAATRLVSTRLSSVPSEELQLDLPAGLGVRYLAVEALRSDGSVSPLSPSARVDAGERVAWVEDDAAGGRSLWTRSPGAAAQQVGTTASAAPLWHPLGGALAHVDPLGALAAIDLVEPALGRRVGSAAAALDWSKDGVLAFVGRDGGAPGAFAVRENTTPRRIAAAPASAVIARLAWSPDGQLLAYEVVSGADRGVHVAPAEGGGSSDPRAHEALAPAESIAAFAWSPDPAARRLAIAVDGGARERVLLVDAAMGSTLTVREVAIGRLAPAPPHLAWSLDGHTLAYRLRAPGSITTDLWAVQPGGAPARVNDPLPEEATVRSFAWGRPGDALVYVGADAASDDQVFLAAPVGNAPVPLGDVVPGHGVVGLAFSPDGRSVALAVQRPDGSGTLRVLDRSGTALAKGDGLRFEADTVAWSPSGSLATAIGRRRGEAAALWALPLGGTALERLSRDGGGVVVGAVWSELGTAPRQPAAPAVRPRAQQ